MITKRKGLFDPNVGIIETVPVDENTEDSAPIKKKKKKKISLYVKALDKLNIETKAFEESEIEDINNKGDLIFDEAIFDKNEIRYENDLKLQKDVQVVQPKQPLEDSYKSIWKEPKIRPNAEFEDEEEFDFDEEFNQFNHDKDEDCAIEAPPLSYQTYAHPSQPKASLNGVIHYKTVSHLSQEKVSEASSEDVVETSATATGDVLQVNDICSEFGEYTTEAVDELRKTIRKMGKEPLMGNIEWNSPFNVELQEVSPNAENATEIQEDISKLHYIKKRE